MSDYFNIGNITAGYRTIRSGSEYNHLMPHPSTLDNEDRVIIQDGSVDQTVDLMKRVAWKYKPDTEKLSQMLHRPTVYGTCQHIWDFLYNHIQYKLDKRSQEQLRRPARSWKERAVGIDCDCFSVFVSTILLNLGIPHCFRITKYADSSTPDQYQHVYVIAFDGDREIIIDCVLSKFDYQKPYSQKKDFKMSLQGIDIAVLSGIDDDILKKAVLGEIDGLDGSLGTVAQDQAMKQHLIALRELTLQHPEIIALSDHPAAFLKKIDYALQYWDDPSKRAAALEVLSRNEEAFNREFGFEGIDDDDDLTGIDVLDEDIEEDIELTGLGYLGKAKKEKKAEKKKQRKENRAAYKAAPKAEKKQMRKAKKQAFFKKMKEDVKKVGKGFLRFNPATIAARNGLLLALKLNLFKMSSRLKWAYATPEQAKAAGISDAKYAAAKKSLSEVEDLFKKKLGGKPANLKKQILHGKHGQLTGLGAIEDDGQDFQAMFALSGLGEAGTVAAATLIAAATPVITLVVKALKKNKSADDTEIEDDIQEAGDAAAAAAQAISTNSQEEAEEVLEGLFGLEGPKKAMLFKSLDEFEANLSENIKKMTALGSKEGIRQMKELFQKKYGKNYKKAAADKYKEYTKALATGKKAKTPKAKKAAKEAKNVTVRPAGQKERKPFSETWVGENINKVASAITANSTANTDAQELLNTDDPIEVSDKSADAGGGSSSGSVTQFVKDNPLLVAGAGGLLLWGGYKLFFSGQKKNKTVPVSGVGGKKKVPAKKPATKKAQVVKFK